MEIFNFFFPYYCIQCGKESREVLCKDCWREFKTYSLKHTPHRCEKCSHLIEGEKCKFCASRYLYFDALYALYEYNEKTKTILLDWKYKNNKNVYRLFLKETIRYVRMIQPERIGFIGSGKWGKNFRSYEVLKKLVQKVSKKTGIPYGMDIVKIKKNKQSRAKQFQRFFTITSSFGLTRKIDGIKKYLIIEDTVTTGATTNEVSRLLKEHGIEYVYILSLFLEDYKEDTLWKISPK